VKLAALEHSALGKKENEGKKMKFVHDRKSISTAVIKILVYAFVFLIFTVFPLVVP